MADFRPRLITLDGRNDEWKDIDGSEFPLRPALDPDTDHEYSVGQMTVKRKKDKSRNSGIRVKRKARSYGDVETPARISMPNMQRENGNRELSLRMHMASN